MDLMMPLMSLWFAFKLPALLGVYWIFQSVLGVVQQYILNKVMPLPTYSEEEIRAILKAEKERANASRAAMRQTSYDSRSLHHIDDDDEEDVYIPEIRSKFDDDEETSAPSVKKPETSNSAPQTHQRQRKKKK
jgi:YidC/Oxa1 family membrane protein insertase